MRDFFKEILKNLHLMTGLKQVENLKAENPEMLKILLDELVNAANRFGGFPDERKKYIIQQSILKDESLRALTPAKVTQWLNNAQVSITINR